MNPLRLRDVCLKVGSGATPRGGKGVYLETGEVALIRSQNVYNNRFKRNGLAFLTEEHAEQLKNVEIHDSDVLLNITGDSVARVCQVPADVIPARVNQHVAIIRPDSDRLDPKFLRFYLASPRMQDEMLALAAAGATRKALTKGMIERFQIPTPSIGVQRAIAGLLGTLEDKIELNRRINETLEAMARTIFKDWFVDFGPTRAKVEGRPPYLTPELWDVFPDALDEKRKPIKWRYWTISELATNHRGTVSPSAEPTCLFEHYSIPAYDSAQEPALDVGSSIKSNKTTVPENSVLLSKLNPNIPRVWIPNQPKDRPQVASTELLAFTPNSPATRSLLYCLFRDAKFRREMETMVTGTSKSHQRVAPKALLRRRVLVGDADIFRLFDKLAAPLLSMVIGNRAESKTLAQTRNLLLPKLVSGEIRLDDAQEIVQDVA